MLFIHQQFQSFLNLGGCKEYPIMSKPKLPKKTNGVKETAATNNSLPLTNETLAITENVAAPIVNALSCAERM